MDRAPWASGVMRIFFRGVGWVSAILVLAAVMATVRHTAASFMARRWGVGAYLVGANLRGADLNGVDLMQANLQRADLRAAQLAGARLQDTDLRWADLRGANLNGADLGGGCLGITKLSGADLRGADLRRTWLEGAGWMPGSRWAVPIRGARYNSHTRWPEGFDPQQHGAVFLH
jgi:uncharacterized protein YjbI with pentapeptide repeats